jgi:RNA polymerase sigma-70 factor (ECF subfamily)
MSGSSAKASQLAADPSAGPGPTQRIDALVANHHGLVWRWLRRLGVWECDADDAAQQVFLAAHRRLAEIACGSERSFLLQTALRVAANWRRTRQRRREEAGPDVAELPDLAANPEELLDRRRARAMLDRALELLPMELRTVFVLFEIEELTMAEIATVAEIPAGTVASRLRRAREVFRENVTKLGAAGPAGHQAGGTP